MRDQEILGLSESYNQVIANEVELEEKSGSPRPTFMPRSRERNIGPHDDWKDKPAEKWDDKTSEQMKAGKLKSRANAVVSTQRRQDRETGVREEVISYLIGEGFASDEKSAEGIMSAMSEAWVESIVDEAVLGARKGHIRSVIGKGGSGIKYVAKGGDIVANDKAANERAKAADMKRRQSSDFNSEFGEIENRRQIKKMNAKGKSGHNRSGERYDVDQPHSNASNASYDEVPTDYRARKRRASGR